MKTFLFICALTMWCANVRAQQKTMETINADLPDETEETDLLGQGQLQAEMALLHTGFNQGVQPNIFQGLIRYGLYERIELRALIEEGKGRDRYLEETVPATAPLALSTKICLLKAHPVLPDVTLVAYLKLPFTSRTREQLPYWSPNVSLAFKHQLGEAWKLEYNGGAQQESFGTQWAGFANTSLHYQTEEGIEFFAEYYGQYQKGKAPQHNAGAGFFIQAGQHAGVYAVAGRSLGDDVVNYFISTGLVVRLGD